MDDFLSDAVLSALLSLVHEPVDPLLSNVLNITASCAVIE